MIVIVEKDHIEVKDQSRDCLGYWILQLLIHTFNQLRDSNILIYGDSVTLKCPK